MAKIEIDSRYDSVATMRTLAVAVNTIADELAKGKPAAVTAEQSPADLARDEEFFEKTTTSSPDTLFPESADGEQGNANTAPSTAGQGAGDATGAQQAAEGDTRVDHNGVPFNAEMCADAAKPFYASGKRGGQWKKRGGANGPDDATYDAWYASALAAVPGIADKANESGELDTQKAFGGGAAGATTETASEMPTEVGPFFGKIAELQAAKQITQDQVGEAYVTAGVEVGDLFAPNDAETVAANIKKVYTAMQAYL